jgi:ABC-type bacteriocin/lantibiotic exporter with double-glycine peptidase domain
LSVGGALFAVTTPLAIGLLFDAVVPAANRSALLVVTLGLCLFAIVAATLEFVRGMLVVRVQARSTSNLQLARMDRIIALPATFFRRFGVGDLASRIAGIYQIEQYLSDVTISGAITGVFSFASFGVIFAYDRALAAVSLVLALVAIIVQGVRAGVAARAGAISSDALQMLDGVAKLRVGRAEIRALSRWLAAFAAKRRTIVASTRRSNAFGVFAQTWPLVCGLVLIA